MRSSTVATGAVALMLAGCASVSGSGGDLSGTKGSSIAVSKATWHNGPWPFTVSHGILGCTQPPFPGEVTFNVDGTVYGINGTALDNGYKDVKPIWKKVHHPLIPGMRVDIGGMIDKGLGLCPK